jgi:hypothetical protein
MSLHNAILKPKGAKTMTSNPILAQFSPLRQVFTGLWRAMTPQRRRKRPGLSQLGRHPRLLPAFVRESAVAMRYLHLLAPLDWDRLPERDLQTDWGQPTVPFASFIAASLVKLDQRLVYMSHLRQYLIEHPALVWVLGFPLVPSSHTPWGFDVTVSLPTARHFTRMLRSIPNAVSQYLLDETARLLQTELSTVVDDFGQAVSLDTKHIIAWVQENNPKDYVEDRYDKTKQPSGDPDCRLGCKRRRNQRVSSKKPPPTPADNPVPAHTLPVGEFYWGYGSGVVATKVPGWGEFVLAELTLPFDQPDVAYFHPLMADTERRLGFRPRYGAFDAAFDAFYVYEYFHRHGEPIEAAFAAVPLSKRGGKRRQFDAQGLPLCDAGLVMPIKLTFICRTTRFEHERGRYACPLIFPEPTGQSCPIEHKNWPKGCVTTLATSVGARIRHQLDRESEIYKDIYRQRTATERINSQAVELGIERPRLRNGQAIANQNSLTYVLINLRALQRVRRRKAARDSSV